MVAWGREEPTSDESGLWHRICLSKDPPSLIRDMRGEGGGAVRDHNIPSVSDQTVYVCWSLWLEPFGKLGTYAIFDVWNLDDDYAAMTGPADEAMTDQVTLFRVGRS